MEILENKLTQIRQNLRKRLFLSSMMEITNGFFCAERAKGCGMVQMGAYLAEPPAYRARKSVLPPGEKECIDFFSKECRKIRNNSPKVYICLNLATPELQWGLEATECFYKAGGDIVELNIHGGYEPYLRLGKIRAMVLSENREELFRWLQAFSELSIPTIVKFREGVIPDYAPILDKIVNLNLLGVHFNIREEKNKKPDFDFVRNIKRRYSFFLLVSGYVRTSDAVKRLFEAGADMVGFAQPTIKDPEFINKIEQKLAKKIDI